MILNTTNTNKQNNDIINDLVGKSYNFVNKLKMNGIGSKRMVIDEVSPNLNSLLNITQDQNYSNIELRPYGIIVFINKGLETFVWAIPYYKLSIYRTNGISIHATGKYIRFMNTKTYTENKKFFDKLINYKVKYSKTYQPIVIKD